MTLPRALLVSSFCVAAAVACSSRAGSEEDAVAALTPLTAVPSERLVVERAQACPAPFDGATSGPRPGDNTGFVVAGQSRRFQLLAPPASFAGPRPILFAFHGTTENGPRFLARAKLADFAARGFYVVAPDAVGNGAIWPVWDAMRPRGQESAPNADLDLFDRLLSCTAAHFAIDKNRVYAAGHSAGGIFTNRLLRSRSRVLAGGIVASGVFDLTGDGSPLDPLDPLLALVTWGGDDDRYTGTTPSGVHVPAFSFVEQASLASKFYDAQPSVAQAHCRGDELGHAWLPLNEWFADVLLARPKGVTTPLSLPPLPAGAPVRCAAAAFDLPPLPPMTCPAAAAQPACADACQLFADCGARNRTVGPSFARELSKMGFTTTSCAGCVERCQAVATTAADEQVLACFQSVAGRATCGPGIEGASPMFDAVNTCCRNRPEARFCVELCTVIRGNPAAKPFFPACRP